MSAVSPRIALPLIIVAVALGGCATPSATDRTPAPLQSASLPDGSVRADTADERVASLWESAEKARREGDAATALEELYAALEIDPRNALLWSRAAEIQLDNEEPALAESFATKSNAFAGDNPAMLYRNWLMIEHSREMRGDLLGVRSAHKMVQQYQYR